MIADLSDCVAVVTGAASGIGRATAQSLAAAGTRVALADVNEERLSEVLEEITVAGGDALMQHCDVSSDRDMAALHQRALHDFGPVDLVMNNVGVLVFGAPADIPITAWQRVLDLNLLSVVRAIREFLPAMMERGSGHFVNTASTAGLWGYGCERLPYVASKAAMVTVSEALAVYCRPKGIGVTCLCPGPVRTNIAEQITTYGEVGPISSPPLALLDADVVAAQVLEAIRSDRFFLPTHDEVPGILQARAEDPEGFIDSLIRARQVSA
jgi:NAD(P)-dependent dehydrogenase (short-subunit alcohol dehydrogenase family)